MSAAGWYVDTISVFAGYSCCQGIPMPVLVDARFVPPDKFAFSYNSQAGRTYIVEGAPVLSPSWTPLNTNAGDNTLKSHTNTVTQLQQFFRVRVQ